jgi:hypothetical protein
LDNITLFSENDPLVKVMIRIVEKEIFLPVQGEFDKITFFVG